MASATNPDDSGDLAYDAVYSGAIGGCVVAAFFLVVDTLNGQPLQTPSLMGSALFGGGSPSAISPLRMDMVAYFTLFHMAAFALLGVVASLLLHRTALRSGHPVLVMLAFFVAFEAVFYAAAFVLVPGAVEHVGLLNISIANALAASSMTVFLVNTARPGVWKDYGRRLHLVQ